MEMHQVRYFLAAARLLNFTRAALECNVSQPSLTKAVQKLEDEFGGQLFRRERARTHLTELGKAMLPHLQASFDAAEAARQTARGLGRAEIAPLALGVARTATSATFEIVLGELGARVPGLELAITSGSSGELLEGALAGALDLVILEQPAETPERLDCWALFEDCYQVVAGPRHRFADGVPDEPAALEEEAWIDFAGDGCASLARAVSPHGVQIGVRHQAQDLAHVRQLVLAGLGCAWMPAGLACEPLAAHPLPFAEVPVKIVLAAVAGRRRSVAADAFVRAARAQGWTPQARSS